MIKVMCPQCGKEKELPEHKLVDLRCDSVMCKATTIVFKQDVQRAAFQSEYWQEDKAGSEVAISTRVGTKKEYLWLLVPAVVIPAPPVVEVKAAPPIEVEQEETVPVAPIERKIFKRGKTS